MRVGFKHVLAGSAAALIASAGVFTLASSAEAFTVDRVVDGDTIVVHDQRGERIQVRLLNINTPELHSDVPYEICWAQEAKAYLESELPVGTQVELRTDVDKTDRYGRTLAAVFRAGREESMSEQIAAQGHGLAISVGKNTKWFDAVKQREDEARSAHRGMHNPEVGCTPAATVARIKADQQPYKSTNLGSMTDAQLTALISTADGWIDGLRKIRDLPEDSLARQMADSIASGELDHLQTRAQEIQTWANDEQNKRAEEAARAAEQARIEAEKEAQRQAQEAQRQAEAQSGSPVNGRPPAPESNAAPPQQSTGNGTAPVQPQTDNYTGCRAYGGKYPPNAVDAKGRPYTRIDCTTKLPI